MDPADTPQRVFLHLIVKIPLRKKDVRGIISDNHSKRCVLHGATQRPALAASGRDETRLGSRKNSKPEKGSKNAPSPTCRLHAVLGAFLILYYVSFILYSSSGTKMLEVAILWTCD